MTPSATSSAPSSPPSTPAYDVWLGFDPDWPDDETARWKLHEARRKLTDWFNDGVDRGEALVLAGGYGCGKTHLARVVLGACVPDRVPVQHAVFFISEPDMKHNIQATYDGNGSEKFIVAQYRRAPLLILDDVGCAHVRQESLTWLQDIYWRIFDRRNDLGLPTLLTTNLSFAEFGQRIGGRAMSRLSQMMGGSGDGFVAGGPPNFVDMFGVPDYRMRAWRGD